MMINRQKILRFACKSAVVVLTAIAIFYSLQAAMLLVVSYARPHPAVEVAAVRWVIAAAAAIGVIFAGAAYLLSRFSSRVKRGG